MVLNSNPWEGQTTAKLVIYGFFTLPTGLPFLHDQFEIEVSSALNAHWGYLSAYQFLLLRFKSFLVPHLSEHPYRIQVLSHIVLRAVTVYSRSSALKALNGVAFSELAVFIEKPVGYNHALYHI